MKTCPNDDVLQRFGTGELDASLVASVSEHVNSCQRCQARLGETLQKQEEILGHLRNMHRAGELPDEAGTRTAESGSIAAEPMRKTIGSYELLETLGEGGLGTVYLAQQHEPVRRRVALKVIKAGMDTRQVVARFEAERQALAVMDHPHVAKVFDGGATAEGRPYFVMELVAGEPITVYCDRNKLSMKERLELFIGVCEAVQHAHQKGIIHRDLKPSNVLVTVKEGKPVPKVIDFGIAKAINQRLTEKTVFTEQGLLIGTPEYMSPEQAEMGATDVDTRTDVYSLGVLLYELLTGTLPFDSKTLRRAGYGEIQRIIRDVEPPRPSTRLSSLRGETSAGGLQEGHVNDVTPDKPSEKIGAPARISNADSDTSLAAVAARRRCDSKTLVKSIRGDLDWIAMKCLEKDRTRRYETANAIALEIRRNLNNEPVLAGPPSASYRMSKLIRRNRGVVIASSVILLTLIGGIVGTSFGLINSNRQRAIAEEQRSKAQEQSDRADKQRANAERTAGFMASMLDGVKASVALGRDTTMLREMLDVVAKRIEDGELKDSPEAELRLRWTIAQGYSDIAQEGAFERAETILDQTLALTERVYGNESEEMATSLANVGSSLLSLGRPVEALPKFEAAENLCRRLFPGDHYLVATAWSSTAACLQELGRWSEALSKHESALSVRQRLFSGDHAEVADSLNCIAICMESLGQWSDAHSKYKMALEMRQRLFTGNHPDIATSLNNVAACLGSMGRSTEALPFYEAAFEMRKRLFRGDHPSIASSLNNIAACLVSLDRSSEALPKLEAALEMRMRLYKKDHPQVARGMSNLANCLDRLGRTAEALSKFEAALEMRKRLFTGDHPDVINSLDDVASCLKSLGRTADALRMYESALELRQSLLKGDHLDVALNLSEIALCHRSLGHSEEAVSGYEAALKTYQRLFEGDHPNVAVGLYNLAACLQSLGRSAEALPKFEASLRMYRRVFPSSDPRTLKPQVGLARTQIDLKHFGGAETLLLDAVKQCENSSECRQIAGLGVLKNMIKLYDAWDAADPARGYDKKAAEWQSKLKAWQATTQPAAPKTEHSKHESTQPAE